MLTELNLGALAPSPEHLEQGLVELEAVLLRIANEAHEAEARRVPLIEAVQDDVTFPALHRLHVGVRDFLTFELPKPFIDWFTSFMERPTSPLGEELQVALGRMALSASVPAAGSALARVLLFEAIRLNVLLMDHIPAAVERGTDSSVAALAVPTLVRQAVDDRDIDAIADRQLSWWIKAASEIPGDVRPLNVLFAAAMVELNQQAEGLKEVLARVSGEIARELEARHELERRLQQMNAPDAVLIRNVASEALGEQRLTVERLQRNHPLALEGRSRNALDQQTSRLVRRIESGCWPTRRAPAVIDILAKKLKED